MADDGIYTTNAEIAVRAGDGVNATAITIAETDKYVLAVEALINVITRTNWSDLYTAGLNADKYGILTEASASLCAIKVIRYGGYNFGLAEAQTRMSVLWDDFNRAIKWLRDSKDHKDFLEANP